MTSVFIIPAKKSDLVESDNEFCVRRKLRIENLSNDCRELTKNFGESDLEHYIQQFLDVYYYVTKHLGALDWKYITFYSETLRKVWSQLNTKLDLYFTKKMYNDVHVLNETKIVLYITNEFISELDKKFDQKKQKQSKAKSNADVLYKKWCVIKEHVLTFLLSVSSKNLPTLYDPPVPEAQFTELLSNCCYESLKDHNFSKSEVIREKIFQILGNLLKSYNHASTFVIKFVHIIKNTDINYQNTLIQGVLQIKDNFEINSIVSILTKEILVLVEKESSGDSVDLKQMMNFVNDLAVVRPKEMVPLLGDIQSVENFDIPSIRICYVSIIGEILRQVYNVEGLSQEDKEIRDGLLEDLYDMLHDVAAGIRSKVLQVFAKLLKDSALPLSWLLKIMDRSVGRLCDKGILVRKNAIVVLKEFIKNRPSDVPMDNDVLHQSLQNAIEKLASLREQPHQADLEKIKDECKTALMPFLENAFATDATIKLYDEMAFEEEEFDSIDELILKAFTEQKYDDLLKYTIYVERQINETDARKDMELKDLPQYFFCVITKLVLQSKPKNQGNDVAPISEDLKKQIDEQTSMIEILKMTIQFSEIISKALPIIEKMLFSKAAHDSNEAITFFASSIDLGISSAYDSLLQVLYLLVTQKENKEQVYKMMTEIFMDDKSNNTRLDAANILKKLCFVVCKMKKSHRDPMCLLFKYWIKDDMISPSLIQLCWEMITKKIEGTSDNDIYACLVVLSLIAVNKPNVVWTNLSVVTSTLLDDFSKTDIQYAIHTLQMLRNMWTSTASLSRSADKSVTRKYNSEEIFVKIHDLVIHHFNDSTTGSFRQLANGAVAVVYAGADQPHLLMEKLVSAMLHAENKGTLTLDDKMKSWRVSRILHTVGQVANNHIAFLDLNVYSELGRRKEIQQNTRQSTSSETPSVNSNPRASKLQSASRSIRNNQSYKSHMDDDNEDNEYQECINSDDLEANFVNDIMEKELLQEPAAFSYVLPFVKDILEHRNKFDDDDLEVDASGALMSFMCISSEACRQNIQLLMTVLRHSKFPVVKTNIIVGFADLLFRFPTVVEPWELYVFERLKDDNSEVKKIGLKFICQLILTNIMRPKSYISDIALFLVDEDDALKTLAEHFFKEMSTKDQNLYNALPDIISKMTDPAMNLVEAKFQKIMKSILSYISKDRHMDGLVQKLCLRLQIATDTAQICNLAFCLSILNYTLKSIQVLIDNFEIFRTHLNIPEVYTVFKNIVALGNKQSVKPEMKTLCTELDNKIEALLDVNQDKENMEEARRKLTKKPVGKPRKKNRQGSQNMSVTFEDSIATRRSSRSQPPRRQIVDDSSTSDEEEVLRENKRRS